MGREVIHVASVSTGKDSQATLKLMIDRMMARYGHIRNCRFVMCDTGNEDEAVFQHREYLMATLGINIEILKADFTEEIARRRVIVSRDQRVGRRYQTIKVPTGQVDEKGRPVTRDKRVGGGHRVRYSNKAKRRVLSVLHPTGNPFLDLCLWKGRFPSRKAQFCTEELKTNLLVEYQLALIDQGYLVVSWQGVRRDESANRRFAKLFERVGPGLYQFRPIILWTAQQTVDHSTAAGLKVNPLYSEGFDRVGCMPCINCGKKEVKNIALRRPIEIDRLASWEKLVGLASKRGLASFFPDPNRDAHLDKRGILKVVQWAKTTRGGRQYDLLPETDPGGCSSSFGLCDAPNDAEQVL